jgi:hypothetical protein
LNKYNQTINERKYHQEYRTQTPSVSPTSKINTKQNLKNYEKLNFNNVYNNDNYYYYDGNQDQAILTKKPCVGITPETRSRKIHTLNIIRSSRMPTNVPFDHVVVTDKYNNKLVLPVAKF